LLVEAGFARSARPISLNLNAIWAQRDFRDIAAQNFDPLPTLQLNAGVGLELGRLGSVSVAYNRIDRPADAATEQEEQRARLVSATYSIQLGRVSGFADAFHDLVSHSTGFMLGLTVPLGIRSSVTASGVSDSGHLYGQIQSSQSAVEVGEFGYQVYAAEGSQSHEFANGMYISPWAQLSAGADRTSGQTSVRLEAQGAISALDGGVFASPPVNDAFAVVDTNGLAGVHVLRENRVAGETDSSGRIFIRDLRSFEVNHITIDPNDVPPDVGLSSATHDVRPQDRSGIVVPFQIRQSHSALLRLVDEKGVPLPLGSAATLRSSGVAVPVGYDGEAYVEDLAGRNELSVTEPDGKRCVATFDYVARPGDIPVIGPIPCRGQQ
jgi:outer membrane usher protein